MAPAKGSRKHTDMIILELVPQCNRPEPAELADQGKRTNVHLVHVHAAAAAAAVGANMQEYATGAMSRQHKP